MAWWDGTDDLGRDVDAAKHGVYKIPAQFVTPGKYTVRGLVHGEIEPHNEFPIYSDGNPAWETADKTCGWLTNHTPPQAALFVPAEKSPTGAAMVYLGSAVSEGGAGLAWVDLNGKKIGGRGWVGGQVPARGWSCPTHALFCIEQTEAHEHPADGANGGHLGRRQAQGQSHRDGLCTDEAEVALVGQRAAQFGDHRPVPAEVRVS